MISAIKIFDLNIKVFAEKIVVAHVFKIDGSGILIVITLINQDIKVLFQIVVLGFKIQYLGIVVFFLVFGFVNVVTEE